MEFSHRSKKRLKITFWQACTKMRIRDSEQLKTVLALYDQDIEQKEILQSYQRQTKNTVKSSSWINSYGIEIVK